MHHYFQHIRLFRGPTVGINSENESSLGVWDRHGNKVSPEKVFDLAGPQNEADQGTRGQRFYLLFLNLFMFVNLLIE